MNFWRHTTIFLLWLLFTITENAFSQNLLDLNGNEKKTTEAKHPKNRDYSKVDAHIKSLSEKKFSNMEKLSDDIKNNFTDEAERVRAIFIWITDNISYDCEKYHHPPKPEEINAKNKKEYRAALDKSNQIAKMPKNVLKKERVSAMITRNCLNICVNTQALIAKLWAVMPILLMLRINTWEVMRGIR